MFAVFVVSLAAPAIERAIGGTMILAAASAEQFADDPTASTADACIVRLHGFGGTFSTANGFGEWCAVRHRVRSLSCGVV
jgi:hypothetical protein